MTDEEKRHRISYLDNLKQNVDTVLTKSASYLEAKMLTSR